MFSIVIPVYNVAPYLMACLDSLCVAVERLRQISDRAIEIICIDDGSTDGSGAILDKYSADKGYIKAVHQSNKGVGPSRNVGFDMATGDWLLCVDSDDEVTPDYLTVLAELIERYDSDAIRFRHVNVEKLGSRSDSGGGVGRRIEADVDPKAFFCVMNSAFVWNTCYRRKVVAKVRFAPISLGEDVLFSCEMLGRVNTVVVTSAPIYHYLQRTDSLAHKKVISLKQVESCGISTLGRMRCIKGWRQFMAIRSLVYKFLRTTYIGNVGMYLENVHRCNRDGAWRIYCKYGRELYLKEDFIPIVPRLVSGIVFKLELHWLWFFAMYWPQCARAGLLTFPWVRAIRDWSRRTN